MRITRPCFVERKPGSGRAVFFSTESTVGDVQELVDLLGTWDVPAEVVSVPMDWGTGAGIHLRLEGPGGVGVTLYPGEWLVQAVGNGRRLWVGSEARFKEEWGVSRPLDAGGYVLDSVGRPASEFGEALFVKRYTKDVF